jgi:hypothetical protein
MNLEYLLVLNLDAYPSETSWTLVEDTTNVTIDSEPVNHYSIRCGQYIHTISLEDNVPYTFTMYDSHGDGFGKPCSNEERGNFSLFQGTHEIISGLGNEFNISQSHKFVSLSHQSPPHISSSPDVKSPVLLPIITMSAVLGTVMLFFTGLGLYTCCAMALARHQGKWIYAEARRANIAVPFI